MRIHEVILELDNKLILLSAPIYRSVLTGDKHSLSESSTTLYNADSVSRSSSSISRSQGFQTPPTGITYESTPVQELSGYRKQPSPPSVFAFLDQEAASRGATPTPQTAKEEGKVLTREQIDKDNEFMAIAAASAEQAGFDVGLVLGDGLTPKNSTISEDKDTMPSSPSYIFRARSPFMEDVEDEDSPHIKRQLGQNELPVGVYWSHAESQSHKDSQSRTESQVRMDSSSLRTQSNGHPSQVPRPNPTYVSTPKALEWIPAHVPLPQPATSSVVPPPKEFPLSHSAPPTESVIQERKNRAHVVERSMPPSRSASLSGSFRSRMGSVREEGVEQSATASRSASVSGSFRSRMDTTRQDSSSIGYTESSHDNASIVNENSIRTEMSGIEGKLEGSDSIRRGREQASRDRDREAGFRGLGGRREGEGIERGQDRTQFGNQKEEFGESRQPLGRRSTEQWSAERQSPDRRPLQRSSTEQWSADKRAREVSLPRRATEQRSTERQSQEEQSTERHSRRSLDSVRNREINAQEQVEQIREVEVVKPEAEPAAKDKSSKAPKSTWGIGKMLGFSGKSKGENKGEASAAGVGLGGALTQARPDLVNPPSHRRSVSEAGGQRRGAPDLTRNNTEEWEQVTVTPPQKSRTSSLREVDMSPSYEGVDSDNMSTNSAPVAFRGRFDPYPEEKESFKRNFDPNLPQHVETRIANLPTLETDNTGISTTETEERPRSKGAEHRSSSRSGLGTLFKAARQFKRAGQRASSRGRRSPPHVVEDISTVVRPAESTRAETDKSEYRPSSSAGVSLHQTELEQQSHVENTWGYSSRGDIEEQRTAEHIPLPTPAAEDGEPRQDAASRPPLSRAKSLKRRSAKSLRKEATGESQESYIGKNEEEAELRKSLGQRGLEGIVSSHYDRTGFSESRQSLERRSTDSWSGEGQSLDRQPQPLQRRSTEHWSTERQSLDKQPPLLRRSTDSLPSRSVVEITEGSGGQEDSEKGPDSRLPVKKGQGIDRKVKNIASPQAQAHDGEQITKTFNCVEKPASALVLTLSEGVDLSSDVKEKQEDAQPPFEPHDIFDDRDSPPSHEEFPLEFPLEPPPSFTHSPTQQGRIPDTFSFISQTPSPVLSPAAVDIYEEYPALHLNNSPSLYSLQPFPPESQDTTFEQPPVHDEEVPSLSDHSTYASVEALEDLPPLSQIKPQLPKILSPAGGRSTIPLEDSSPLGVASHLPEDRSFTPTNNFPVSPIREANPLSSFSSSGSSLNILSLTSEDPPALPQTKKSSPIIHVQEPSEMPVINSSSTYTNSASSEGLSVIPAEASDLPVLGAQQIPSSPLNGSSAYIPVDVSGTLPSLPEESPVVQAQNPEVILTEVLPDNHSFASENVSISPVVEAQAPPTVLKESTPTYHEPIALRDLSPMRAHLPPSPIYEDQESAKDASSEVSYSSPVNTLAEVPQDISTLPLPPVELHQSPVEYQFPKGSPVSLESQSESQDSLPIVSGDLPALPEASIGDLQQPVNGTFSLFAIHDPSSFLSSEIQTISHFEPKVSLSMDSRPLGLVPEQPQSILQNQSPSPPVLPIETVTAQPELPQLDTALSYDYTENLPGLPLSGPSSPATIDLVPSGLPAYAMSDPDVTAEETLEPQPPNFSASPATALKESSNSLSPVSDRTQQEVLASIQEPSNNLSSPSLEVTKPTDENLPLLSRPPPPKLSLGEFGPTSELPETSAELPETTHSVPVLPLPAVEEMARPVVGGLSSIATEDESVADAPLNKPASPTLPAMIPNNLSQLPASDPSPPYDLPETPFEFYELPIRDHVSLSPIIEELSESAVSRSPSIAAKDGYFPVLPMSTPTSPVVSTKGQNNTPESSRSGLLSPVQGLALDRSLEPELPAVGDGFTAATDLVSPTVGARTPNEVIGISQDGQSFADIANQPEEPFALPPAATLEAASPMNSPSTSLSTTATEPEVVSEPEEISTSSYITTMESVTLEVSETGQALSTHGSSSGYGIESESTRHHSSIDGVQLSSIPEITNGSLLEPELPLSEGVSVASPTVSVKSTVVETPEMESSLQAETIPLEHSKLVGSEVEPVTARFSVEGIQFPSFNLRGADSVPELENLLLPEDILTPLPSVPVEPLATEVTETDKHPLPQITTKVSGISVEHTTKEFVQDLYRLGKEEPTRYPIYELPPVEIEVNREFIQVTLVVY